MIKFDNSGNQLWFKTLGSGSTALQASEIIFDNNSILFSGNTDNGLEDGIGGMNSQKGNKDVYLTKISKEWDFKWLDLDAAFEPIQGEGPREDENITNVVDVAIQGVAPAIDSSLADIGEEPAGFDPSEIAPSDDDSSLGG